MLDCGKKNSVTFCVSLSMYSACPSFSPSLSPPLSLSLSLSVFLSLPPLCSYLSLCLSLSLSVFLSLPSLCSYLSSLSLSLSLSLCFDDLILPHFSYIGININTCIIICQNLACYYRPCTKLDIIKDSFIMSPQIHTV